MRETTRSRVGGLIALVVLAALVVGVPVLLVRIAGWPLPTSVPDWERVRRGVTQGDIPADVVVNVLAVVVWLIWLQLVWAIAWELVVNVPRLTSGRVTRPAPLVPASVGNGVGRLIALVLTIGTLVASSPSPAVALPTSSAGPAARPTPTATVPTSDRTASPAISVDGPRWKVQPADSLWKIAQTTLGDGERSTEILEQNRWLGSPRHLRAGQVLDLPADAIVPEDRQPEPATPAEPAAAPSANGDVAYLDAASVVVEPGDTLWDLAEERLAIVDSDVTPAETLAQVNEVIAANRDVVEDPNLIYPGEVISLPAVGTPPPPPTRPADVAPESAAAVPPTDQGPPGSVPGPNSPPLTTAPAQEAAPVDPLPPVATSVPAEAEPAVASAPATTAAPHDVAEPGTASQASTVPWLAGISGATALASGLVVLYRRRLTVRAARGASAYRDSVPSDPTVLAALTRAADVPLLRWANTQLCAVTARLRPNDVDGQPLAVELSEDFGIELLWTAVNQRAPAPWQVGDDGWTWTLPYDPDDPVDTAERPAAIPALVTIGTRDGNQLMLNLEAVGTLAVDGDDQRVSDFVRAVVAEAAVDDIVSDAYLVTCGVELDGLASLDRVQQRDREHAQARLSSAVDASRNFLRDYSLSTAFASRLGGDAAGRETTIVAVDDEYASPLVDVVPGLSAALVYTGAPNDGSCVRISDDGYAVLQPHGIEFDAACLPLPTVETVSDLLDEAAEPYNPPVQVTVPTGGDLASAEPDDDLGADDDWQFPEPAQLVRVFGAPEILGTSLGPTETNIVTYIACHGGTRRDRQIINAVWNGRAIELKTLWNKMAKVRAALGEPLVPSRQPNSPIVTLSDAVMTDLHILAKLLARADHVAEAEAVELLLHGLDLIDGVPFDANSYDWAYETQDYATACETVETATLRCVEAAMNLGDLFAARHAVTQGLRALPMNEPLYRARMRIEAASGNPDGVRQALGELTSALNAGASDAETPAEPEAETVRVARTLMSV